MHCSLQHDKWSMAPLEHTPYRALDPGVCSFCSNFIEHQILWSLSSVDFHTLTLQLAIQTQNTVASELQVFVSSLQISAKRAHPRFESHQCLYVCENMWIKNGFAAMLDIICCTRSES